MKGKLRNRNKRPRRKSYIPPPDGALMGSVDQGCGRGGFGRNTLYNLDKENPGLIRKLGGKSLVDLQMLDKILMGLPALTA